MGRSNPRHRLKGASALFQPNWHHHLGSHGVGIMSRLQRPLHFEWLLLAAPESNRVFPVSGFIINRLNQSTGQEILCSFVHPALQDEMSLVVGPGSQQYQQFDFRSANTHTHTSCNDFEHRQVSVLSKIHDAGPRPEGPRHVCPVRAFAGDLTRPAPARDTALCHWPTKCFLTPTPPKNKYSVSKYLHV